MEKTIILDEKNTIKLSNNVGWLLAYRDQIGVDIVPALIPVLNAAIELAGEITKAEGGLSKPAEILMKIDSGALQDAAVELAGLQITDFINVVWAMAKSADGSIPEPAIWVRQFETFPLDELVPAVLELAVRGLVSGKNSRRLLEVLKVGEPEKSGSTSTASSQPALNLA